MANGPSLPPPKRSKRPRASVPAAVQTAAPAAVAAGAAWCAFRSWLQTSKPDLTVADGELKQRVVPLCTLLQQPYAPAPLACNNHLQNILAYARSATIHTRYARQLIIAHDGGTLGLDWFGDSDAWEFGRSDLPVLLILHGINGGSHEGYCKWMCHEAVAKGWRAVVLNYRGCNGLPLTSPRGYAATLTHDVHYAITSIKARFPDAPVFAVGYSLGGLFLTKYLAEADAGLHGARMPSAAHGGVGDEGFDGSGLVAAAVVSSPICLFNSSANLNQPWTLGYLYNMALAYKLREFVSEHALSIRQGTSQLDLDKALRQWTVAGMEDEGGIPRTFGFRNRQEYYEAASSLQFIPAIHTPTLFLLSRDDPFLGVLPDKECAGNPNTLLAATQHGGHVAFLQGWWPLGPAYMEGAVLQFLDVTWQAQLPVHRPPTGVTLVGAAPDANPAQSQEHGAHLNTPDPRARSFTAWLELPVVGGLLLSQHPPPPTVPRADDDGDTPHGSSSTIPRDQLTRDTSDPPSSFITRSKL